MSKNLRNIILVGLLFLILCVLNICIIGCGNNASHNVSQPKVMDTSCTNLTDSLLNMADDFKARYQMQQKTSQNNYSALQKRLHDKESLANMTRSQLEELIRMNEELLKITPKIKDSVIYNISYKDTVIVNFKTVTITDTIRKEVTVIIKKKKKKKPR